MSYETGSVVSIPVPCYNAHKWVGDAIRSALAQTYPRKEAIVVDDGSADVTLDAIKSLGTRIPWENGFRFGGGR